jgi:hypothetical protein
MVLLEAVFSYSTEGLKRDSRHSEDQLIRHLFEVPSHHQSFQRAVVMFGEAGAIISTCRLFIGRVAISIYPNGMFDHQHETNHFAVRPYTGRTLPSAP